MYTITLKNCAFFAHHGALSEETRMGQRFYVDAVLRVETTKSLSEDDLSAVVNYADVFREIETLMQGKPFQLIESLAFALAQRLIAVFPLIRQADIRVRKPSVPIKGVLDYVEVSVTAHA